MTPEFGYVLAFATGVLGAFHCLGMCGGIAAGVFVHHGWQGRVLPQLYYHGTRILVYSVLGVSGAQMGQVLVQSGAMGKGQGLLMIAAGGLVTLIGTRVLGLLPPGRTGNPHPRIPVGLKVRFGEIAKPRRPWIPAVGGLVNGLVPCALVFSVAVKAVGSANPLQAGLLMLAFGLGTLPTMAAVSLTGTVIGAKARGLFVQLAGLAVSASGLWTLYEGAVFFDIMRGLGNW